MIITDVLPDKRITEANTVILSRPFEDATEFPVLFKNGNSAVIFEPPNNNFEDWLRNPTLTFIKSSNKEDGNFEDIFVSPVKSTIKVKMKVKIGGKVPPIPVDSEDIVYLDE